MSQTRKWLHLSQRSLCMYMQCLCVWVMRCIVHPANKPYNSLFFLEMMPWAMFLWPRKEKVWHLLKFPSPDYLSPSLSSLVHEKHWLGPVHKIKRKSPQAKPKTCQRIQWVNSSREEIWRNGDPPSTKKRAIGLIYLLNPREDSCLAAEWGKGACKWGHKRIKRGAELQQCLFCSPDKTVSGVSVAEGDNREAAFPSPASTVCFSWCCWSTGPGLGMKSMLWSFRRSLACYDCSHLLPSPVQSPYIKDGAKCIGTLTKEAFTLCGLGPSLSGHQEVPHYWLCVMDEPCL